MLILLRCLSGFAIGLMTWWWCHPYDDVSTLLIVIETRSVRLVSHHRLVLVGWKVDELTNLSPIILEEGHFIPVVNKFCYLGSIINHDLRTSEDVDNRIKKASQSFGALRRGVFISTSTSFTVKGCLHSPNFIRPSTRSRSMEPDGNRNAPSPMLPCTMRTSNVHNQSLPNMEKTNFHLPTSKRSKIETDWNLHLPTSDEVGWTCLTHALEPPTPKSANSMVQLIAWNLH